jgi:hypothetical protein
MKNLGYYLDHKFPAGFEDTLNTLPWDVKAQLGAFLVQVALDEHHNGLIDAPFSIEILPQPDPNPIKQPSLWERSLSKEADDDVPF